MIMKFLPILKADEVTKHEAPKYKVIPVKTRYIKPEEPYDMIIRNAADLLEDGDFLVVSETPIAISQGRMVDEKEFKPSIMAFLIAEIWSKYIWGYILGPLFGMKKRTIKNLRKLPPEARSHKEVVLKYYGLKHALKPASEAGIDLSNAPGTYVSLLPDAPQDVAWDIKKKILRSSDRKVIVMIIDTDATYEIAGIKFTSLPTAIDGIKCDLGIFGYILGRFGKLIGPTPLAISDQEDIDKIIQVAKVADGYYKKNKNIETIYDVKNVLGGEITNITVKMLDSIDHIPAIIIRETGNIKI